MKNNLLGVIHLFILRRGKLKFLIKIALIHQSLEKFNLFAKFYLK